MFHLETWVIQAVSEAVKLVCAPPMASRLDDFVWACEGLRDLLDHGAALTHEQRKQLYACPEFWDAKEEVRCRIGTLIALSKVPCEVREREHAAWRESEQRWWLKLKQDAEREKAMAAARDYYFGDGEPQRIRAPGYERRLERNRAKRTVSSDRRTERRLRQRSRECVSCG